MADIMFPLLLVNIYMAAILPKRYCTHLMIFWGAVAMISFIWRT